MRYGDLVLNRRHGGRGRAVPIVQYCPVCLGAKHTAYLRRGWRFSIEVACAEDGCFLLDACWKCGAFLIHWRRPCPQPRLCASSAGCHSPRRRRFVSARRLANKWRSMTNATVAHSPSRTTSPGHPPSTTLSGSHPVICGAPIQATPPIATMPSYSKRCAYANGACMGQAYGCARSDGGPQRPADQAQGRANDPASRSHCGRTHGLWINIHPLATQAAEAAVRCRWPAPR